MKRALKLCFIFVLLAGAYAPILWVAAAAIHSKNGYGLAAFQKLFADPLIFAALKKSLGLAVGSAFASTVLGLGLALVLAQSEHRKTKRMLYASICVPDIVMGSALLLFFSLIHLAQGLFTMWLAHVSFELPFVTLLLAARIRKLDPALFDAARDLGASESSIFQRVTLPLLGTSLAGAFVMAFTLSLDDFVISFFTSGPGGTTLPILIFSSVKRGITPEINAVSTLIVLLSAIGVLFFSRFTAIFERE